MLWKLTWNKIWLLEYPWHSAFTYSVLSAVRLEKIFGGNSSIWFSGRNLRFERIRCNNMILHGRKSRAFMILWKTASYCCIWIIRIRCNCSSLCLVNQDGKEIHVPNIALIRLSKNSPTYSLWSFARVSKSPSGKRFSLLLDNFLKATNRLILIVVVLKSINSDRFVNGLLK